MFSRHFTLPFLFLVTFLLLPHSIYSQKADKNITPPKNLLTIGISDKFYTINPINSIVIKANSEAIRPLMYNSLITRNNNLEFVGELAKEINILDKGKIIEFVLFDNIAFHNTKILTAADVEYTLKALLSNNWAKSSVFDESVNGKRKPLISKIKVVNSLKIHLYISNISKSYEVLEYLALVPIVAEGSISTSKSTLFYNDEEDKLPIGTGAYKLVKFESDKGILELVANKHYWQGIPSISNLQIKTIDKKENIIPYVKSNKIDIYINSGDFSSVEINKLKKDNKLKIHIERGNNIQHLNFNTQVTPLDNKNVRQAIAYAINRESIIDDLLKGNAVIAHSILPKQSWAYSSGYIYSFNPTKAKKLLIKAGFKDKNGDGIFDIEPLVIKASNGNKETVKIAQALKKHLVRIGLPIKLEVNAFDVIYSEVSSGKFQMYLGRWLGGNQNPRFLHDLFSSSQIPNDNRALRNRSRYKNKTVDMLLAKAILELDMSEAKTHYQEAQNIISKDMPLLPLWYPSNVVITNQKVYGDFSNSENDLSFVKDLIKLPLNNE